MRNRLAVGTRLLVATPLAAVTLLAARGAFAAEPWGDFAASIVERAGYLGVAGAEVGKSGAARGAGIEVRYMMPVGWGAYWRFTKTATQGERLPDGHRYDWGHFDFGAGFSRRVAAVGGPGAWAPRAQLHVDLGMLYTQLGTNGACTPSYVPFGTTCETTVAQGNASGLGLGLEGRVAAELGLGPIGIGVDAGVAGYRRVWTTADSLEIPGWFYAATAQLRVGIALPF